MSVPSAAGGTIRRRVVRTLALPVAAVVVLLAVVTVIETGGYRRAAESAKAVVLALAVQDLAQELQTERGLAAGLLGGNAGFRGELGPARQRVDQQRARLDALADGDERLTRTLRNLDGLAGVRAGTDQAALQRPAAFAFYTDRIAELNGLDVGLDSATDPELRRGAAALQALGDAKESMAQERAFLNGVFSASGFRGGEFLQFVTMRSAKDAALANFSRYASTTQRKSADYVFGTGAGRTAGYFEQVALGAGDGRFLQVNPQSWWSALTTVLDDMLLLGRHVGSAIQQHAAELRDQAARRMAALAVVALLCFGGSAFLAVVASRSIARPLATLAGEADRLAADRLPAAVRRAGTGEDDEPPPRMTAPPGASDEVRSVADALDRVQATAYRLATEQAQLRRSSGESLADLARRSQNLLRRQLGFITRLEGEETDPTGLANLFELDHLATRMRRNAESLLVLVGAASPRTWSEPLPVSDVIRAAVAEVEEYRRVTLRRVDDALLSGAVVSGVAHMLAELVENGLSFSAPDVDVEIQGRLLGDHYLIAVVDQGVGMDADELAEANRRLRGEGDFLVAPTRFLGHYVAGRLARDLGVGVELTPSPVTGLTARLLIPAELLALPPSLEAPASEPDVEILEPASALMADGRLRPVTVEYVTAPPFLPMQREAADDWLLREAADGRLMSAPTDRGADGSRPGAAGNGYPLGAATDGRRLGAITDGHQAGAATDGRRLGAITDGHQAGAATDGRRLSATTDGQQPGADTDKPEAATEGRRLSAATDGRVPSASTGGRTPNGLPRRPPRTQRQQVNSARSTDKSERSEMSERVDAVRRFGSEAADAHTPEHDAAAVWGSEHQAAGIWGTQHPAAGTSGTQHPAAGTSGTQHPAAGPWLDGDETSDAWEPERETAGEWRPEHEAARSHSAGHNGWAQDGPGQQTGQDGPGQQTGHDARAHRAEHDAAAEPEEVRARLEAFRAGVHRGNS